MKLVEVIKENNVSLGSCMVEEFYELVLFVFLFYDTSLCFRVCKRKFSVLRN